MGLLFTAFASMPSVKEEKVVEIGYMSPFTGLDATEVVALSAVPDYG